MTPDISDSEILPASWQDIAEKKGIPEDQIFRSWRRFKEVSAHPFQLRRWRAWVDREYVREKR